MLFRSSDDNRSGYLSGGNGSDGSIGGIHSSQGAGVGYYEGLKGNIKYAVSHPEEMKVMAKNCVDCAENKFNRPKQILCLNDYLKDNLK